MDMAGRHIRGQLDICGNFRIRYCNRVTKLCREMYLRHRWSRHPAQQTTEPCHCPSWQKTTNKIADAPHQNHGQTSRTCRSRRRSKQTKSFENACTPPHPAPGPSRLPKHDVRASRLGTIAATPSQDATSQKIRELDHTPLNYSIPQRDQIRLQGPQIRRRFPKQSNFNCTSQEHQNHQTWLNVFDQKQE